MIRVLEANDAEELFQLRRQALEESPRAFLASSSDDIASSVESVRELLCRGAESPVFGACNAQIVGMLGLYRDRHLKAAHKVYLWGMYVRPDSRGKGLGLQLVDAAIGHARSLEGVRLVHVSVSEIAEEAKRLYERAGFETWGIEPDSILYRNESWREFHMALPLP